MRGIIRFIFVLFMPVILVVGGAGLLVLGLDHDSKFLVWTGLITGGVGILWGLFLFLLADSGSFFD